MSISVATPRSLRGLAAPLRVIVRRVMSMEGHAVGEIAIVLSDDAELRALNRRWRGIDRATDVLSFPYDSMEPVEDASVLTLGRGRRTRTRRPAVSGDLVISVDRLREQAKRFRVTPGRELARLVIHGALHLAGHDHYAAAERRVMRGREDAALRATTAAVQRLDAALAKSHQA
jgi:probable rRNA maturation factor